METLCDDTDMASLAELANSIGDRRAVRLARASHGVVGSRQGREGDEQRREDGENVGESLHVGEILILRNVLREICGL